MAVDLKRWRFSVKDYQRMGEVGILSEDDRVELLEGEVVEMTPIRPLHAGTVVRLTSLLSSRLGDRVVVSVQNPLPLPAQESEPQPDLMLLKPRPDFYATGHPEPPDVLLLVEVMDTSVERDRRLKLPLYARGGVSEVWLVDLNTARVEVYRGPGPDGYRDARVLERSARLTLVAFPDLALTSGDVLG